MQKQSGFTLVEMMVASAISLVVVLGLGQLILVGQDAFGWGMGKVELQRNVSEAIEWMARAIRAANSVELTSNSDFSTYDENGNLVHRYSSGTVAGEIRLLEDGGALAEPCCTEFSVTANADTTNLIITLEMEDDSGNRVAAMTSTTLRNRNLRL